MNPPLVHPVLLRLIVALPACWPATRLPAQDVSVSPIEWSDPRGAPDELPAFKRVPSIVFPAELQATPDIGYVAIEAVLDDKGRLMASSKHGTTEDYKRVSEIPATSFTPGRREGKAVTTAVSFGVLFNPASAAPNNPETSPRLVEFTLVRVPLPRGTRPGSIPDQVIPADLTLNENGTVTAVKNAPPEFVERFANAAKLWKFAPARRGGQAVAAELRVPFIVVTGVGPQLTGKSTVPKAVTRVPPIYPFAMRRSGMRGEVVVDFVVDIEGRVRNPYVVRSLNPAFDDPALESVRKWRFEPGRIGEVPVSTHMQVPIQFVLQGAAGGGDDGMVEKKKADLSKLPEEFRYDTPPRLTGSARAVYPYARLMAAQEGKASVSYVVGENGRVIYAKVISATAPEFGHALLTAVEQFVYAPAIKNGQPGKAMLTFTQEFKRDEGYQSVTTDDLDLLRREQKKPQSIVKLTEIDGKLTPLSRRPPRFPLAHREDRSPGEASVEVVVDEDGRARLPRIISATDDSFGYAALQGVADWRFEPPTRGGKPAAVRVQIPIIFRLPTDPGAAEVK